MFLTLKKPFAILALLGACVAAHAVPTLELQETPPLKPLHYCKDSTGAVHDQIEDCGPAMTEVSSISTQDASGKAVFQKLGTTMNTAAAPAPVPTATPAAAEASSPSMAASSERASDKDVMRHGRKSLLKFLAFVVVFGVGAKLTGRSFLRWAFVGAVLNFVLVGLNLISS